MKREKLINNLKQDIIWDVIIIGGGATGLGAAVESTTRGYKTLLLEQLDFTIGTSSRSTKLVHGGVRYLEQGDISMVFEALNERGLLLKNAPHLVKNQTFLIPSYALWHKPFYTLGLVIYDILSGRKSFGKSRPFSRKNTINKMPNLIRKNLRGGITYHDGQFDDARLGLNLAQTAIDNGATVLNYIKVTDLQKEDNKITGVLAKNQETGEVYKIKSKAVINATGVFVDDILKKDNPNTKKIVKPSQGVHIVIDKEFLQSDYALLIPKTKDGRVLFAVPWHDKVILGTTDEPKEKPEIEPKATDKEIDFILETASRYLIKKPTRKDIKSVFAGLRPLAAPDEEENTKEISRTHKIIVSDSNLISVIGGKWTTYREMGEDIIDKLQKTIRLPKKESITENLKIHGYQKNSNLNNPLYFYGSDQDKINELINKDNTLSELLSKKLNIIKAQVVFAVKNEFARNTYDVLARRTRSLFLDVEESIKIAPQVIKIIAKELNKDNKWQKEELKRFIKIAEGYLPN
jgi:glycerol-3-phosphate dehydrogenase